MVGRESGISLEGRISHVPEQPCPSKAAITTPQNVLSIWKLVELKMLDSSDHMRAGISILKPGSALFNAENDRWITGEK